MILNITAMASLALPSAVSVAPRVQSHRSHRSASFARGCPQYGQGISSPTLCSGRVAAASVYSTLISIIEGRPAEFVKQSCCWPRDNASVESAAKVERRASSFPRILHAGFRCGGKFSRFSDCKGFWRNAAERSARDIPRYEWVPIRIPAARSAG
jgi:hypothetical protein